MDYKDKNVTIGSVVAELPQASRIFAEYGIDFCCGGHRNLFLVIKEQGLEEEKIYEELDIARKERKESYKDISFQTMSPTALTHYIEDTHHSYMRETLPEIAGLLATILRVHGMHHKELFEVYKLYGALKTDLEQHLLKEEAMLFPAFSEEQENHEDILNLSRDIINEHEAAGEILVKLRTVTNDYRIPEDVCPTFERTYQLLKEMESDLHQHISLENNILLAKYDHRSNM